MSILIDHEESEEAYSEIASLHLSPEEMLVCYNTALETARMLAEDMGYTIDMPFLEHHTVH